MSFVSLLKQAGFCDLAPQTADPVTHREMVKLLEDVGCALSFDMEGDFFEEGAHSRLAKTICALQNMDLDCSDCWIPERGWLLTATVDGKEKSFFAEQTTEIPSDWVEWTIVRDAVHTVTLPHKFRLFSLFTEDQVSSIALLPTSFVSDLRKKKLVADFDPYKYHEEVDRKLNIGAEEIKRTSAISAAAAKRLRKRI